MAETPARPITLLEQKLEALLAYTQHLERENAAIKAQNQTLAAETGHYAERQRAVTERLEQLLDSLKSLEATPHEQ